MQSASMKAVVCDVMRRLSSMDNELIGFPDECKKLKALIEHTAINGESNSILIVGRRGCGKSQLLHAVLKDLDRKPDVKENLFTVYLNGVLHTDDKLALRSITEQLHLEAALTDKTFPSVAETLRYLLALLRGGDRTQKSILCILDEFDLFAQHRNQALLYNLFDCAQTEGTPLCVVGMTARLDVLELLEKRVKSRFSHRQIYLTHQPSTFGLYLEACKSLLKAAITPPRTGDTAVRRWNPHVDDLLNDTEVIACLKHIYAIATSLRTLKLFLMLVVSSVAMPSTEEEDPKHQLDWLQAAHFTAALDQWRQEAQANLLQDVSIVELYLLTAAIRLNELYEGAPMNFEMIYDEYSQFFCGRGQVTQQQLCDRAVAMKSIDHLTTLDLLSPTNSSARTSSANAAVSYRPLRCLVGRSQLVTCVSTRNDCPTDLVQWSQVRFGYGGAEGHAMRSSCRV